MGKLDHNFTFFLLDDVVGGEVSSLEPSEKRSFSTVSNRFVGGFSCHLNVYVGVVNDASGNKVDCGISHFAVHEGVRTVVQDSRALGVERFDRHVLSGECACLAGADLSSLAEFLRSLEVFDKDAVLFVHTHDRKSQGDGDDHRKAFRNSYDNDDHSKGDVVHDLLDEVAAINFVIDSAVDACD